MHRQGLMRGKNSFSLYLKITILFAKYLSQSSQFEQQKRTIKKVADLSDSHMAIM